jgi:hypothetical protein
VRVPVGAEGGALDALPYRTARRWTDLVGFACADGTIEAPPKGGLWPRCTGTRGVLFTASIPGPGADGDTTAPTPATMGDFTFAGAPWGDATTPSVARCEGSRQSCSAVEIRFAARDARVVIEPTSEGTGALGTPDDTVVFVGYHVTGAAPSESDFCQSQDNEATLRADGSAVSLSWVPPADTGEVTFWFTARRYSGGFTLVRRTARVE